METINLKTAAKENHILYSDENIALGFNAQELQGLGTPMFLDGFFVSVVIQGMAQIYIDDQIFDLHAGDIVICHPRHILERSMSSLDICVRSILVSSSCVEGLLRVANLTDLNLGVLLSHHKVAHATPIEVEHLVAYHDLLLSKLQHPDGACREQSLNLLLASLATELYDIVRRSSDNQPMEFGSSAELIMKRFLSMLNLSPFLNVNGYAERLCIHPKYFSSVCRKVTGKAPSQIIADEIINRSQVMLREGCHSIKQIADMLGFANQSHFGTFFRRHTGMSPHQFIHHHSAN